MRQPTRERRRRRVPTRGDVVVMALLALLIPLTAHWTRPRGTTHSLVIRTADGVQRVDAAGDQDLTVHGPLGVTEVRLRQASAWIVTTPCRNRLCQRMGKLQGPGRSLVCIPNQVVVHFSGEATDLSTDAITR